jgi:membrane fusion protein, macrolide-specific efflux system
MAQMLRGKMALLALALAAAGAGAWVYTSRAPQPPEFRTISVARGDIAVTVLAAGVIEASQLVSVGARVSGQIQELAVGLGQDVKAGDVIAQIDRQDQENEVLRAQAALSQIKAQITAKSANLRKASAALARQQQLAKGDLVSREAIESAAVAVDILRAEMAALQAQADSAQVNVAQSRLALERTTITAPMDGTVVAVAVEQGQTVSAAQNAPTLVKIAQLDTMIVKAEISEADVVRVAAGQKASFTILGDPDTQFPAELRALEPAPQQLATADTIASDKAVYFNGLLQVANPERRLRIGMTAQVSIVLDSAQNALLLPVGAVDLAGADGPSVQVLVGGAPQMRGIKTGLTDKVNIEILDGLAEGELVILPSGSGGDGDGAGPEGGQPRRPRGPFGF